MRMEAPAAAALRQEIAGGRPQWKKGGLKTIPCIIANEVLEKVATFGLLANMIIYLTATYHMKPAAAAVVLLLWGAIANFLPILGAFLADSWLGKFRVIAAGSFFCLLVGTVNLAASGLRPKRKSRRDKSRGKPMAFDGLVPTEGRFCYDWGRINPVTPGIES